MPPAARQTDQTMHQSPHCHAPIHPPAPTPTPLAHPPMPLPIMSNTVPTVLINNMPAATVTSMTQPCMLPTCVPGGPGVIMKGSMTVLIGNKPAARAGDMVQFAACVGPIPCPAGTIMPPCSPTVQIGG
jgi:uncharacterized Zn-binding protein involved in type VI secretion